MKDRATIVIDCDEGTVEVNEEREPLGAVTRQAETSKASLVAMIMAVQSRELMIMSKQQLMAKHLSILLGVK